MVARAVGAKLPDDVFRDIAAQRPVDAMDAFPQRPGAALLDITAREYPLLALRRAAGVLTDDQFDALSRRVAGPLSGAVPGVPLDVTKQTLDGIGAGLDGRRLARFARHLREAAAHS